MTRDNSWDDNWLSMLDWDDFRVFLAVSRLGNLSAAAKELRVAQSTVGRRLASFEANLGVRLLDRTPDGYVLTPTGHDVLAKAQRVEIEALALERTVGGRDTRLSGPVRVTCAETIAAHILAPCVGALHKQHPDIVIELLPDSRHLSLAMREAEVSVRLSQPAQHDLVIRRIGNLAYALYATQAYLDLRGPLDFEGGCTGHHLIGQSDDVEDSRQFDWLSELAPRAETAFKTSSHEAAVSAAVNGTGLACLACFRADLEPGLLRLAPPTIVPTSGIWLVVHKDNRDTSRIRAVMTHIADYVRQLSSRLVPEGHETFE